MKHFVDMTGKQRNQSIDVLYGILGIGIVYLHSGYAGGFSIYDFGSNIHVLKQVTSLFYLTFVPMFFILYGYLSSDAFFSKEANWSFIKRKIPRFLPLYIFFLGIAIVRDPVFWQQLSLLKITLGVLGLYHEPGITGGHIVFIVNLTLFTRIAFKLFNVKSRYFFGVLLVVLALISNFIIERPAEFYVLKYFGYYMAVIFGLWLKNFNLLDREIKDNVPLILIMGMVSLLVPILNFNKINVLEITYSPNSIEQVIFSGTVLIFSYFGIRKLFPYLPEIFKNVFSEIGRNSFAHFIIQIHVIGLFIYCGNLLDIPKTLVQLMIIATASVFSIFVVFPLWEKLQSLLFRYTRLASF